MNEKKLHMTLRELVIRHQNDYGFDVSEAEKEPFRYGPPSLSIVIPYYQGRHLGITLASLYGAIAFVLQQEPNWDFEVIIVDDGSRVHASDVVNVSLFKKLKIRRLPQNKGRTAARNVGLFQARCDLVLFMDADILLTETILMKHLCVHAFNSTSPCITVGLFSFIHEQDPIIASGLPTNGEAKEKLNDFRIHCIYQETWIGCEEDKRFVGREFFPVNETREFRTWPSSGYLGPWILPNMVLGGFFMVRNEAARSVRGFDTTFLGYGFTETSLPTKLIAAFDHMVIPVQGNGCLHIEDAKANISQSDKDRIFREKHAFYFKHYLALTLAEALYA